MNRNLRRKAKKQMKPEFFVRNTGICLVQGDITDMETDAIVNAANSSLLGGGGVDGAIHGRGGPQILEECKNLRATEWPKGLPTGEAAITTGGHLKAKNVIHTVGPVWHGGSQNEHELLAEARSSLKLAVAKGLKTIAFPSISTGAYGYPIEQASRVAFEAVKEFLEKEDGLSTVTFVLFTKNDFAIYTEVAKEVF